MALFINRDKKIFMNTMQTQTPTRRMQFRNITLQYDTVQTHSYGSETRATSVDLLKVYERRVVSCRLLHLIGLFLTAHVFLSFRFILPFFKVLLLFLFNARRILLFSFSPYLFVTILFLEACMFYQLLPVCSPCFGPSTDDENQPERHSIRSTSSSYLAFPTSV